MVAEEEKLMSIERVLVTGSEGFIGSHVVELLVRKGYSVKAHVLYNSFSSRGWLDHLDPQIVNSVELFFGDLRDRERTREALKDVSAVLHLASLIAIPYSYVAARSYFETNTMGLLNLLEGAREVNLRRIVHTSTSEVYGTAQYVPMDERHPTVAQSPYAASKIAADQLASSYFRSFGLPITTIRPFNTFGPRQSIRAIIPTIVTQLLSGRSPLRLGNTSPTRDLNYVDDVAKAFLAALEVSGIEGETINVGTGLEVSVGQLVEMIIDISGRQAAEWVVEDQRKRPQMSEVERLVCDSSKARRLLRWEPQVSLREGLQSTFEWFSNPNNLGMYRPQEYGI